MRRKDRYDTTELDENQFEPGSRRRVLYLVENGRSILPQCALAWTAITNR
jgi:hypothetical protein